MKAQQTFAEALRYARGKAGYSYTEVSRKIGRDVETVKSWEDGKGFPYGRDRARLCSIIREIRPYIRLIPHNKDDSSEPINEDGGDLEAAPPPIPTPPAPKTFGEALRAARLHEGLNQSEIGELLGVHGATISNWEKDRMVPVKDNYDKLLTIFSMLKNGPVPPIQDINAPIGRAGGKRVDIVLPAKPQPVQIIISPDKPPVSELESEHITQPLPVKPIHHHRPLSSVPTPAPIPVPTPTPTAPSFAQLSEEWSQALLRKKIAVVTLEHAKSALEQAERELVSADEDLNKAVKLVEEAAEKLANKK